MRRDRKFEKINVDDPSSFDRFKLFLVPSLPRSFLSLPSLFSPPLSVSVPHDRSPSRSIPHSFAHPLTYSFISHPLSFASHHLAFSAPSAPSAPQARADTTFKPMGSYARHPRAARRLIKHAGDTGQGYITVCAPGRSPAPSRQARREEKGEGKKEKRKKKKKEKGRKWKLRWKEKGESRGTGGNKEGRNGRESHLICFHQSNFACNSCRTRERNEKGGRERGRGSKIRQGKEG